MRPTLLVLMAVSVSCCSKASTQQPSYVVSVDDEYAIYRAIIDLESSSFPGMGVSVDAALSQVGELERFEAGGFDPVALSEFKRVSAHPSEKRLDSPRLNRSGDTMNARYTFAQIGFDARGISAVTYGAKSIQGEGRGNVYALVRTADGRWAVTLIRTIWIT